MLGAPENAVGLTEVSTFVDAPVLTRAQAIRDRADGRTGSVVQ